MRSEAVTNQEHNNNKVHQIIAQFVREGEIVEVYEEDKGYNPKSKGPNWTNEDGLGRFRKPLYRVKFGENDYAYKCSQLFAHASSEDLEYRPYHKGEKVVVLALEGNPLHSVIIGSLPCDTARPPVSDFPTKDGRAWSNKVHQHQTNDFYQETLPSNNKYGKPGRWFRRFVDGSFFVYYFKTSLLKFLISKLEIDVKEFIKINSNSISITGKNIKIHGSNTVTITGGVIVIRDKVDDKHGHIS